MKTKLKDLAMFSVVILLVIAFCTAVVVDVYAQSCEKTSNTLSKETLDAMYNAAQDGDLELVKSMIEKKGMDVNQRLINQQTALIVATYNGQVDVAGYLLKKGADVSLRNKWNNAALHDTGLKDRVKLAHLLIKFGADVNQKGQNGYTPLHHACQEQNANVAKVFIDNGADVNARDDYGQPPIMIVSWNGNIEIMQALVDHGADVNFAGEDGYSVLHSLSRNGRNEALSIVLAKNANVNRADQMGMLPVHNAVKYRHSEAAALLIENTKDINAVESNFGNTPFHIAAINGDITSSKILMKAGARADIENNEGKIPLDYAVQYGHDDLVELMISQGMAKKSDLKKTAENRLLIDQPVNKGEAKVVYAGHSGWFIQTENKVLIFDYWANNEADQPSLTNGTFNSNEMQGKEVYVFVSHDHQDHYDQAINEWANQVKSINYIYGFDPKTSWVHEKTGYDGPEFTRIKDNSTQKVNDVKVTTITSNDTGQGFLVEADGITIWHPGDHAWFSAEDEEAFKKEIDFIATKGSQIDFAFLPVIGCPSRWTKEYIIEGFFYSIEKLKPKTVYPMHAFQSEYLLKEFAELAQQRNNPTEIICVENKGDNHVFTGSAMASK